MEFVNYFLSLQRKITKNDGNSAHIDVNNCYCDDFFPRKGAFQKQWDFSSQHIHDSEAMKERGIHCVMDQDREMRRQSRFAVNERNKKN